MVKPESKPLEETPKMTFRNYGLLIMRVSISALLLSFTFISVR